MKNELVHLDCGYDTRRRVGVTLDVSTGRLEIILDDYCDVVSGFFRSKEDIEKVRDELNKHLEGLNE